MRSARTSRLRNLMAGVTLAGFVVAVGFTVVALVTHMALWVVTVMFGLVAVLARLGEAFDRGDHRKEGG
jgi:hypothetical protein